MAPLKELSPLYGKLSDKFDNSENGSITFNLFSECVDIAKNTEKRELKFLLFQLSCLYDDVDTGIGKVNIITNTCYNFMKTFTGKNKKIAFIYAVLETALEEK